MSDTPLTDVMAVGNSTITVDEYEDMCAFARQLERGLAKAQAEINRRVESAWKLEEEIARMRPVVEAVMERHADNKFSGWLGKWCEDYEAGEKP